MFYDNLKAECEKQGLKITPIVLECGGNKGSITGWKNGAMPNSDIVMRLSVRLNVPTDVLLFGRERTPEINFQNSNFENIGAVGHNISGTINIGTDDASYENSCNTKHIDKNASISADNDEWADELLRIFKALPLKERAKIMLDIYDIEAKYSKKK